MKLAYLWMFLLSIIVSFSQLKKVLNEFQTYCLPLHKSFINHYELIHISANNFRIFWNTKGEYSWHKIIFEEIMEWDSTKWMSKWEKDNVKLFENSWRGLPSQKLFSSSQNIIFNRREVFISQIETHKIAYSDYWPALIFYWAIPFVDLIGIAEYNKLKSRVCLLKWLYVRVQRYHSFA